MRVPSGVSYVMTNRRAISAALPETTAQHRIRPVGGYPQRLLGALRAAAPAGVTDPTVVVLTPGVYNGAYFEHALLARTMGVELVEGRDLVCRRGEVMMRTTQGLAPVHVIYRRIDDEYLDPVHFRADSMLGCPGMIDAARAGNVTLANAVGNGVADDKLVYTYLPDIIRYYLAEEPVIRNVDTWRVGDPEAREEVLDRLDELVLKPVDGSGGKGIVIGPHATAAELAVLREKVLEDPRSWIAQPVVQLSTVPTFVDGELGPRHVDLRPFAVNDGERVWVLPGGLTRVALGKGELIVNSSRGGGTKDTWVLAGPVGQVQSQEGGRSVMLSRIAESMFWIGRYVERAEDTARILDVQTQLLLEDAERRRVADLPRPPADHGRRARGRRRPARHRHHARGRDRAGAAPARLRHDLARSRSRPPSAPPARARDGRGRSSPCRCGRSSTPPTSRSRRVASTACGRRTPSSGCASAPR